MNRFTDQYGDGIRRFWDNTATDAEKVKLLADVLAYANKHPQQFKIELKEVLFDAEIDPLSIVLEALSKDTDNWGGFFVEILHHIFDAAYATAKADSILFNLTEFYYIENDTRPFVQKIADKLLSELDSSRPDIRIAAIKNILGYLNNPSIKNTTTITNKLTEKLNDENWKVRCVAYQFLGLENLLPGDAKLRLSDKLSKLIFGQP